MRAIRTTRFAVGFCVISLIALAVTSDTNAANIDESVIQAPAIIQNAGTLQAGADACACGCCNEVAATTCCCVDETAASTPIVIREFPTVRIEEPTADPIIVAPAVTTPIVAEPAVPIIRNPNAPTRPNVRPFDTPITIDRPTDTPAIDPIVRPTDPRAIRRR